MTKYKKVFVTGKTGSVGSNLHFGEGLSSKKLDLCDSQKLDLFLKSFKPDAIIHCAACVGGLKFHLDHKYNLFYDNLIINTNLINSAKNAGVKRVLSYLSSCIFSDDAKSPYSEKDIYYSEPSPVHQPYGHAKRMLEVHSRICYDEGLKYNCVIPTNIYGYNDNFNLDRGHVVASLIRRAFTSKKENKEFVVWGDGKQERDFIFTEDIAKLTEWALDNYFEREPLIFSANKPVQIGQLAFLIAKKFNIENKLVFDTSKPSGQKIRRLNGNKLADLTNFKFTSIDVGINKTIDWFMLNYPNVRL